jgi:hypothetical protein
LTKQLGIDCVSQFNQESENNETKYNMNLLGISSNTLKAYVHIICSNIYDSGERDRGRGRERGEGGRTYLDTCRRDISCHCRPPW